MNSLEDMIARHQISTDAVYQTNQNGQIHGELRDLYSDGLRLCSYYMNGQLHGISYIYGEDDQIVRSEYYDYGVLKQILTYYSDVDEVRSMIRFCARLGQVESRRVRIQTYDREGELEETKYYIEQEGGQLLQYQRENGYFSDESDITSEYSGYGDEDDSEPMSYATEDSDN